MTSKNILVICFIFVSTLFIIFNFLSDSKRRWTLLYLNNETIPHLSVFSLFPQLRNLYNRDILREVPDILPRRSSNYTVNSTIKVTKWLHTTKIITSKVLWFVLLYNMISLSQQGNPPLDLVCPGGVRDSDMEHSHHRGHGRARQCAGHVHQGG